MQKRPFDKLMNLELNINGIKLRYIDVLFMVAIAVTSYLLRIKLFPIKSGDFYGFLDPWMNQIRENGGFKSLSMEISDYTSPYMYLMCLATVLTPDNLLGIKCISLVFDYIAAFAVFFIVINLTSSIKKALFGFSFILLSPAVLLNSAYWGQCDIIYTALILWALYYLFKDNSFICFIFIGLSFSFKLQTTFIFPFLIIMWLKNKNAKLYHFLLVPPIYIVMQLPAFFFGRSFSDLMTIYFHQSEQYPWPTMKFPNVYYLICETLEQNHYMEEASGAGLLLCISLLGFFMYYIYTTNFKMTNEIALSIALFSVALTVYTLPHMHDRYGILVDLIAIVIATINPKKIFIAAIYSIISVLTYVPFLTGVYIVRLEAVALINGGLLIYLGYDLLRMINEQKN